MVLMRRPNHEATIPTVATHPTSSEIGFRGECDVYRIRSLPMSPTDRFMRATPHLAIGRM